MKTRRVNLTNIDCLRTQYNLPSTFSADWGHQEAGIGIPQRELSLEWMKSRVKPSQDREIRVFSIELSGLRSHLCDVFVLTLKRYCVQDGCGVHEQKCIINSNNTSKYCATILNQQPDATKTVMMGPWARAPWISS